MRNMLDIVPIVDKGLGNSSYVLDLGDGQGMVIDPERDPTPYLSVAEQKTLRLRWAVETHLHADFVSGGRELAAQGAQLLAPLESRLLYQYEGLADGDEVDLGGLTLRVVATPGHTPEHCSYLLVDGKDSVALFSGGTLIAGGVARTDLISPDLTEELARLAYRSIKDRLLTLPDDLPVYPTHGPGSFCSASADGRRTTTIGLERRSNPLLQAKDEDDFVRRLTEGLGTYPPYFLRLREMNQSGPGIYGSTPPRLAPLPPEQVVALMEKGAQVIDLRPIADFAGGHVRGSLSIELRDQFAPWLGWLVDPERVLVFVVGSGQNLAEAVRQCLNIGYENFGGYLAGGMRAWHRSGQPISEIGLLTADEIPTTHTIVDVRQQNEWESVHAPDAIHLELGDVAEHSDHLSGELVLHCGHGHRAMTGASLLERAGWTDVAVTTASVEELLRTRPTR